MTNIQSRLALPFFLFSLVFAGVLGISRMFIIPRWASVEAGGTLKSTSELQEYERELRASIASLEEQRSEFILQEDPTFASVKQVRAAQPSLLEIRKALMHTAAAVSKQPDAVHIERIRFLMNDAKVEAAGDVRFVGPTSMTVLAQFMEGIERLPFVESLERPPFRRDEDPKIGFHSPFSFSFSLAP